MSLPSKQFWMVYGIGQRAPAFQHPSSAAAAEEAKRLARACPGTVFVVLEAVGAVVKREFDTITFRVAAKPEQADDGIPF